MIVVVMVIVVVLYLFLRNWVKMMWGSDLKWFGDKLNYVGKGVRIMSWYFSLYFEKW